MINSIATPTETAKEIPTEAQQKPEEAPNQILPMSPNEDAKPNKFIEPLPKIEIKEIDPEQMKRIQDLMKKIQTEPQQFKNFRNFEMIKMVDVDPCKCI